NEYLFDGEVRGSILSGRKGDRGFGYDPVFSPTEDSSGRSFAEMTSEEKNRISHRGRALRKLTEHLKNSVLKAA
ncbi:MAG TPA: non-canonical purine NTP pyrophosphatase, partial [Candidatus Kapabacteria bacterium]|nr:non-canonical purine NTP pyrophosphatase [Candidatus Kapabacteria bacterium]